MILSYLCKALVLLFHVIAFFPYKASSFIIFDSINFYNNSNIRCDMIIYTAVSQTCNCWGLILWKIYIYCFFSNLYNSDKGWFCQVWLLLSSRRKPMAYVIRIIKQTHRLLITIQRTMEHAWTSCFYWREHLKF